MCEEYWREHREDFYDNEFGEGELKDGLEDCDCETCKGIKDTYLDEWVRYKNPKKHH